MAKGPKGKSAAPSRVFSNKQNAVRGARKVLGADAKEGTDFELLACNGGRVAWQALDDVEAHNREIEEAYADDGAPLSHEESDRLQDGLSKPLAEGELTANATGDLMREAQVPGDDEVDPVTGLSYGEGRARAAALREGTFASAEHERDVRNASGDAEWEAAKRGVQELREERDRRQDDAAVILDTLVRDFTAADTPAQQHAAMKAAVEAAYAAGVAAGQPGRQPRPPRERKPREAGAPNKRELVAQLLQSEAGATRKDILAATGWPAVSVPAVAKASGLELELVKEAGGTRYYGAKAGPDLEALRARLAPRRS